MIIKVLLLLSLAFAALLAVRDQFPVAGLAVRRLTGLAVITGGAVAIVFPNLVTALANLVGVGRGTDLVLYVLAVVSLFVWIAVYRRFRELESRIVALTRDRAVSDFARDVSEPQSLPEGSSRPPGRPTREVTS
jgi:hypothetical protein